MGNWVEPLEGRALFSLVIVPANASLAYDAILQDRVVLHADVTAAAAQLRAHNKTLAADIKALGNSKANAKLLRATEAADAKAQSVLSAATSRYVSAVVPAINRLAYSAAVFGASPTPGNSRRLATTRSAVQAIVDRRLAALDTVVTQGGTPVSTALNALAASLPDAAQLAADVHAAEVDQEALGATQSGHLAQARTDLTTFLADE